MSPELDDLGVHFYGVGQIIGNFHSLEVAIRLFLERIDLGNTPAPRLDIFALKAGDCLPKTALTDYDSLGQLINRYNTHIPAIDPDLAVDRSVVELRDTLAHGRMLALEARRPLRLFRFGPPDDGTVEVRLPGDVTDEWIAVQRGRTSDQLRKVLSALARLGTTGTEGGIDGPTG